MGYGEEWMGRGGGGGCGGYGGIIAYAVALQGMNQPNALLCHQCFYHEISASVRTACTTEESLWAWHLEQACID